MKAKITVAACLILVIGAFAGWFANAYVERGIRKAQGTIAYANANEAAKKGDLDKAIEYGQAVSLLDRDSPVANFAALEVKEWVRRRSEKLPACK
jgi:hypothetical protein